MTITAFSGPLVTFKDGGILTSSPANQNPDQGPCLFNQGSALLDPRAAYTYFPGMAEGPVGFTSAGVAIAAAPAVGWLTSQVVAVDYAPSAVATANIAALQHTTASTALTLVSTTAAGITVGDSITNASTGATVTGLLRIDNTPAVTTFGQSKAVAIWDPANPPLGRALSFTTSASMSSVAITIAGYDAYGYPQTEVVTLGSSATTVNSKKTYKWIASLTASATDGSHNVSVGTADIFGLPLRADSFFYVRAYWNAIRVATSSDLVFTAADTTSPATTSTGDVRGTININAAGGGTVSNGTIKLQAQITIPVANISTITGLYGVTPV
jgi:hypothetical protein